MITNIFAVSVQHFCIIQAMKTKATLKTRLMLYGSIGASIEVWWAVTVARVVGCGSYKWHIFMWHIWNSCFSCALAQVPGECFIPLKKCPDPQQQETFLTKIQNHISKKVGRKTYYLLDFLKFLDSSDFYHSNFSKFLDCSRIYCPNSQDCYYCKI